MPTTTLQELIRRAWTREVRAEALYKGMRERAVDPVLRELLDFLVDEEASHVRELERRMDGPHPRPPADPVSVPGMNPEMGLDKMGLLALAIEQEAEEATLYRELARQAETIPEWRFYVEMSDREVLHGLRLKAYLQRHVTRPPVEGGLP